ncbi:MAG TPA: hypothetical protein VI488_15300 [Candidatus Angelobacter sp.]
MKLAWLTLTVLLLCAVAYLGREQPSLAKPASGGQDSAPHRLADSMQRKLDHIRENAASPRPDQEPTVITEEEVNDYFASGRVALPQGVKKVTLQGKSGVVDAFVNVDFDEIRAGQRSSNPLLAIFSGRHDVQLQADVAGSGGQGKVHVRSVNIDSVEVPRVALEFFVEKFLKPKYPNVGLDSEFQMPSRIDTASVGYHKLTLTQK